MVTIIDEQDCAARGADFLRDEVGHFEKNIENSINGCIARLGALGYVAQPLLSLDGKFRFDVRLKF